MLLMPDIISIFFLKGGKGRCASFFKVVDFLAPLAYNDRK